MANNLHPSQQQALKTCVQDAYAFMKLLLRAKEQSEAPLLFNGLIANVSMFIFESHRCLTALFPSALDIFPSSDIELLRASRHRAKLLDDTKKTIEEVTTELVTIAKRQREIFLEPHSGLLGPLKRAVQPDMGLSIYDNHIFTTTHSTIFGLGEDCNLDTHGFAFGETIGAYIARFLTQFRIEIPSSVSPAELPGNIGMRDIKYEALYNRGKLGAIRMDFSAGLVFILANLNFTRYILPGLLPTESLTLFRMKFIAAFHANSSLKSIQDRIMADKLQATEIENFFKEALGNSDSRWLRKRRILRNLLTHYLPDSKMISDLPANPTWIDMIEHFSEGLSFDTITALLDRNIAHLSGLLETGYHLAGDPFWLGKVK